VGDPVRLFESGSAEYAAAFQKLVACDRDGDRELLAAVDALCAGRPREARAADWGAGTGVPAPAASRACRVRASTPSTPSSRAPRCAPESGVAAGRLATRLTGAAALLESRW